MSRTTMRGWIAMAAVWMVAQGWVGASDWPQWRGPNRDGVSAETVTISAWPPVLVWSNTIAAGESAVVVSGCFAYTMGREGGNNYVYCFDTATGSNVWTQSYTADAGSGSYGPQATPTVFSNEVYTFDDAGKLYCFDKVTGAPLWNATVPGVKPQYGYSGSPLVEGNQVLLMASAAGLAVNRTTHAVAWPGTSEAGTSYASPVAMTVSGTRMLLFLSDSALNAVSTNGTLLWSYAYDSGMISGYAAADPVVSGDKILLYENGLVLLQATTNSVTDLVPPNLDAMGAAFSTPVVAGGYAYAINSDGELVRINLADGTVDWNMAISDGKGALVYVDGKLIVLANGKLRVVKIGASGFDEEGREPLVVRAAWDPDYAWTPPALSAGKVYCRIKNNLACYSLSGLESGASLAMDTNDLRVVCPIGTVVTQEVTIANAGDQPLTWTLTDGFEGTNFVKIARQFKVNWSSSPTMLRYDETRDCLWASYFFGSVVAQISVTDGSLLGTKSMGTNVSTMCAIDIEGGNLWGQHSSQAKMVKFNLNDMSVLTRVSYPSGWWRMEAMARGDGKLYAYSWWQGGEGLIYRLDPATGATLASYPIPDSFLYTDNRHFGYADGAVWWGARTTTPYNRLVKWDPVTGKVRARFTVEGWQTGVTVHDVTSSATNTQVWALTGTHQVGLGERWAHLVDLSGARRLTESASGGTIGAGGSVALKLTFNGVGASSAFWPVRLRVESDGGNAEKLVTFVTHAPGANHAPTANAGPDQVMEATSTSAVTRVTLDGSGSSDPDADALKYIWTEGGATVYVGENPMPTVNLGPGVHDLTLTVNDYRGGVATDTMRITLNAPDIAFDPDPYILCPQGSVATGSVQVLNLGTRTLNWTVNQTNAWVNISPLSGSIAASSSAQIQMVVDRRSAALGRYPVQLVFSSNDPDEGTATNTVNVIVHAPGPNHPPVAHPRTNGTVYTDGTGAIVLYDAGSTDPDGDDLRYKWLENGTNVGSGTSCIVERGFGTHTFTLTVDDYRGMTNTADVQITVTNRVLKDWEAWYGTDGSGWIAASNGWVANWPPVVVWRQPQQMSAGGYSGQSCPVISEGRVYYTGYFGAFCMDLATGVVLWRDASFQGGNGTPAVDEGRVYGSSKGGNLSACWNKFTGARLWSISVDPYEDGADGSGSCVSPSVHGDIAVFNNTAVNKYTGAVLWLLAGNGNSSQIMKSHTWNGRTYLATGYTTFLVDMRTGFPVLRDIGGSYGSAAGTVFYGENMTWDVRQMKTLGGGLPENIAGAGVYESYHQPIVVGDYGYYKQGGHGSGGCMAAVNLKEKRLVWTSPRQWETWIAAGDKVIAQGNREVALIKAGVNSYVEEYPAFRYDQLGGAGFTLPAYADQKIVLGGGLGMTCLSVAYSVPVVNNGSGVRWDETAGTATLNGNLVNTGGKPATVYVYWGRQDGGTNKAAWERCENLGVRTAGPFDAAVTPLRDTVYYYRCYASNSVGGAWATGNMGIYNLEPSQRFNTYTSGSSVNDETLLLHWTCEEINGTTVADVSGNGNHGTVSGSSYIRPGVVGNAMWCDADRDAGRWIGLSSPTLNETLNGDFSMSYWLNIQTYYGDANPPRDFFGWSPGGLSMGLRSGCKLHFGGQLWPGVLSTGSWYHVAFTRTGSNHVMYVDGAQGTPGFSEVVNPYTSFGFSIDRSLLIDDLRVYRKALSLDEIRQLGAMGSATNAGTAEVDGLVAGTDDAEEWQDGGIYLSRTNLYLGRGPGSDGNQKVGLRFPNVAIPRGATILNASIQFKAAGSGSDETRLVIRGEAADNAAAYAGTAFNVSARTYTVSAVEWTPPAWTAGAAGVAQRTPDLAGVLQEMVTRPGWTGNSALAFGIVGTPSSTGQVGQRIADAIEKPGGAAAVLRVVWRLDPEPLRVEYASSVANPNRVAVKFDRQVSEATAETVGNYRLSGGVEVSGAELGAEGDWVRLTVSGMTTGRVYRLTVNGVKDLSVPVKYVAMEAEAVFTCMGCPVQFIRKDTTTQGTWKGMYGQDGQAIYWVSATYPTYVTVSGGPDMNSICIWSGSTSDVRGLQRPGGSDRVATAWHDRFGPLNLDVNLTDGNTHQVALYYVDWDLQNRCEKVEVIEYGSGRIWDTQILGTNTFTNGVYLVWNMSGHQIIRTTNLAPGKNAVMSGVFFDPAAVLPGPDEDHDGVEDVWEVLHYGNTSKTLAWLQATDSDKDGMMDWEEYVAGTRPLDQWSYLALTDAGLGQSGLVVRWTSETNHVYDLWRSTNLTAGFDLRIGTNLAATPPMNVYTDQTATCNCLFYRVEVK